MLHAILASSSDKSFWMPQRASSYAGGVDWLFYFIFWLSVFFFFLILGLLVLFIWKYRHRKGHQAQPSPSHSTALELTWTIIPTILVIIIFYFGFRSYLTMAVPPPNAYEIIVTGKMWAWEFAYPNGHVDNVLHVPVDTPVRLVLTSQDVIHSLYVPAFRVKRDAVPGRYNKMWFKATQMGEFDLFCAEYCGQKHSEMITKVVVHDSTEFRKWLEEASNWEVRMTPLQAGAGFYVRRGCNQCHSVDGSQIIGPSFKDLYGVSRVFADGGTAVADENYIRESIREPQKHIVAGYDSSMPSFSEKQLKERDVMALIIYLKSLSSHYKGDLSLTATRPAAQPATQPANQ